MTWVLCSKVNSRMSVRDLLWQSCYSWKSPSRPQQSQRIRLSSYSRSLVKLSGCPPPLTVRKALAAAAGPYGRNQISVSPRPLSHALFAPFSSTRSVTNSNSGNSPNAPQPPDHLDNNERHIWVKLASELNPSRLEVRDISGGCGSMYDVEIVSSKFKGMPMVKQHRLINDILKEEIAAWHGIQLRTRAE